MKITELSLVESKRIIDLPSQEEIGAALFAAAVAVGLEKVALSFTTFNERQAERQAA